MSKAYFSPSNLIFIPELWETDGTYTEDNWPSDAVLLTEKQTALYWKQTPPAGKQLGVVSGLPAWVDIPPPTHEQLVSQAEQQKNQLRKIADSEIEWRKYAVDKGIATVEESSAFEEWNLYRVLLMRIDTTKAPGIEWPPTPAA